MPEFAVAASSRHIDSGTGDHIDIRPGQRRLSSAAGVFALLVALLSGAMVAFGPAAPAAAGPAEDIFSLVNEARTAEGRAPLTRNAGLDAVAAAWAQKMASMNSLEHNPNVGKQIPSGWSSWAENIAQGHPSGTAMQQGWMNSPGHYANIMGDFSDIGVAFISAGGTTWGVQVFATYSGGGDRPAAPPASEPKPAPAPEATAEQRAAAEREAAEQAAAAKQKAAAQKKAAAEKAAKEAAKEKAAKEKKQAAAAKKKRAEQEAAAATSGSVPTATAVPRAESGTTAEGTDVPLSSSFTSALSPAANPAVLAGMGAALLLALILLSPTMRRMLFPRRRRARHR